MRKATASFAWLRWAGLVASVLFLPLLILNAYPHSFSSDGADVAPYVGALQAPVLAGFIARYLCRCSRRRGLGPPWSVAFLAALLGVLGILIAPVENYFSGVWFMGGTQHVRFTLLAGLPSLAAASITAMVVVGRHRQKWPPLRDGLAARVQHFFGFIRLLFGNPWRMGGMVSVASFGVCLLLGLRSPEYAASALLKLDFVRTNGLPLSSDQYATNDPGWSPLRTEARVICSDLVLHKAQARLGGFLRAGESADDRLHCALVPGGIRIRATDPDAWKAALLVNTVAEVYRDECNRLSSAPPGCQGLSIQILKRAQPPGRPVFFAHLFRSALGGVLFGLAAAVLLVRKSPVFHGPFVPTFLFWFSGLFGSAIVITPIAPAVALTGALLCAFQLAAVAGCAALVVSLKLPVPAGLLKGTFWTACILSLAGGTLTETITSRPARTTARLRVSVLEPAAREESPRTYDPRFIETECELLRSRLMAGRVIDHLGLKPGLDNSCGCKLSQQQAEDFVRWRIQAKAVRRTSLIDVSYLGQPRDALDVTASKVAEVHQAYWRDRSQLIPARQVTVSVLNSVTSSTSETQSAWGRRALLVSGLMIPALFVFSGVLCVAVLAGKQWLSFIPFIAILYLSVLGIGFLLTPQTPQTYTATCLVRIWPPTKTPATTGWDEQDDKDLALLQRERDVATSEQVLASAAQTLAVNPNFMTWEHDKRLLKQRLNVTLVEDTFLMELAATAEKPEAALEIVDAVAAAYSQFRSAGPDKLEVEVLDRAAPAMQTQPRSNSLAGGLMGGAGVFALCMLGAGIGYIGYLVERARRVGRARAAGW